jgi:hypothetical protein
VNVVEQQNASTARLKPLHRQRDDFLRQDTVMPVIRHCVGAEVNEYPRRKLTLDNVRARQSRYAKEWRNLSGVIERGPHVANARVNFPFNQWGRQFAKAHGMIFAMGADGMTFSKKSAALLRDVHEPFLMSRIWLE